MKLFGYPEFDENGVRTLCTYDNEYSHMLMDVRIYRIPAGEKRSFCREGEEIAALLQKGKIVLSAGDLSMEASRKDVFTELPYAAHVCTGDTITIEAIEDAEVLIQCTHNDKTFPAKLYGSKDTARSTQYSITNTSPGPTWFSAKS